MTTPTLREAAMAALRELLDAYRGPGHRTGGFCPKPSTRDYDRRLLAAITEAERVLAAPQERPLGCTPAAPTSGEPTAREAAETLIEAGHEFWLAVGREDYKAQGAVQWLTADDDALIIFTRGEYRQQLLANIHTLPGSTALIFSEPGDEDADVKSLDAFLRAAPGTTPPSAAQAEGAGSLSAELEAVCTAADAGAGGWVTTARVREALTAAPEKLAPAPQQAGQADDAFLRGIQEGLSMAKEIDAVEGLAADQVEWVVNDIAELGVKIGNQFFFLYKGYSLVYGHHDDTSAGGVCLHDSGEPMHWRPVGKREFGECCHPVNYEDLRKCGRPHYIGTVSLDDSDEWKPLPSAHGITTPAGDSE